MAGNALAADTDWNNTGGDRVWAKVEFADHEVMNRPGAQGGTWFLAKRMRVLEVLA